MMMGLLIRYRYWAILHVVAIVVCCRGKASSELADGCVESRLTLRCPEMKLINITAVVLGESECTGTDCCIRDTDCTYKANDDHTTDVHRTCDNKQSCNVDVLKERIPCITWGGVLNENNDFERITYVCIDDPRRSTTTTLSKPDSTETILYTEENTPEDEEENDNTNSSNDEQNSGKVDKPADEHHEMTTRPTWVLPVIMAIVCLLILIAIVVVVVILRRKTWSKGGASIELTDIDYSDRDEAIYANENQTTCTNNGSRSQVYSNNKIKKSKNKCAKASEAYEVPNDVVYSLAESAGPLPREDPIIYCDVESIEPEPRSNVYSIVRDDREPESAGSTENAPSGDNNICGDVITREPAKATNISAYDEACNWKESEYKAAKADKVFPSFHQPKKMESAAHKTVPDSYAKASHPLTIAATSNSEAIDIGRTSDALPSPSYETMSPGIQESIYANQPVLSPSWSVASRVLSTGSEAENPYCEMRSPSVSFRDDGSQTVVENDLYSH